MLRLVPLLLAALFAAAPAEVRAQAPEARATPCKPADPEVASDRAAAARDILAVLNRQVADWNRGDLEAFASGYKNSPDILFIGREVRHGYAAMLAGYKAAYNTPEKRGTLSFTGLDVQPLDARFATVTGHFHIARSNTRQPGASDDFGYFLLVLERTPAGWKIIRDDTTATPPPPSSASTPTSHP